MRFAVWRPVAALALALPFLAGCSTLLEQHLETNQELVASCEKLSAKPPPGPIDTDEFLRALETRVWPTLASCPAASVQLVVDWDGPAPSRGTLVLQGLAPLLARKEALLSAELAGGNSTLEIGKARYAHVRVIEGPATGRRKGKLVSARPVPVPVTFPDGADVSEDAAAGMSLIACGLAQGLPEDPGRLGDKFEPVRESIAAVDAASDAAGSRWREFRKELKAQKAAIGDKPQAKTYREWIFSGKVDKLLARWVELETSLAELEQAVDTLQQRVHEAPTAAAWHDLRVDMLAFAENSRTVLRQARHALFDEARIRRDHAKGQIAENFALKYLNLLDRSLVPLERGFDNLDEKAYGLGSAAVFFSGNPISKRLGKSYLEVKARLCTGPRCSSLWGEFDEAVGRASCKRLDEPVDHAQSSMLMQYVYRFYALVGAGDLPAPAPTGAVAIVQAGPEALLRAQAQAPAASEAVLGRGAGQQKGQQVQHALAEWSVRRELLVRDIREQLRDPQAGKAAAALVLRPQDEAAIEAQATAQAADQVVDAWALVGPQKDRFSATMQVQNNIAVSQQVAVKVVNQQSVVNNLRVRPAATRVSIEPGAIQVNVPFTTVGPQPPAPRQFCSGAAPGNCRELPTGFQWTVPEFAPRSAVPPATGADYDAVAGLVRQVEQAYPGRAVHVEVHGFASREPYACPALPAGQGVDREGQWRDYAPSCQAAGSANPRLSFDRALHVWSQLKARIPSGGRLHFAPPLARGAFEPSPERKVEVRVFADPA